MGPSYIYILGCARQYSLMLVQRTFLPSFLLPRLLLLLLIMVVMIVVTLYLTFELK